MPIDSRGSKKLKPGIEPGLTNRKTSKCKFEKAAICKNAPRIRKNRKAAITPRYYVHNNKNDTIAPRYYK